MKKKKPADTFSIFKPGLFFYLVFYTVQDSVFEILSDQIRSSHGSSVASKKIKITIENSIFYIE